ncbi:MAG TPA: methyltransferase domain-containing protein [Coriobacteriia bacterium]|nr:methyltransferase domain-containing protein [Coriobacteriia bacterium]
MSASAESSARQPEDQRVGRPPSATRVRLAAPLRSAAGSVHTLLPQEAEGSLDACAAINTLCFCAHADRVLAEVWRMLRPGGRLIVVHPCQHARPLRVLVHQFANPSSLAGLAVDLRRTMRALPSAARLLALDRDLDSMVREQKLTLLSPDELQVTLESAGSGSRPADSGRPGLAD